MNQERKKERTKGKVSTLKSSALAKDGQKRILFFFSFLPDKFRRKFASPLAINLRVSFAKLEELPLEKKKSFLFIANKKNEIENKANKKKLANLWRS